MNIQKERHPGTFIISIEVYIFNSTILFTGPFRGGGGGSRPSTLNCSFKTKSFNTFGGGSFFRADFSWEDGGTFPPKTVINLPRTYEKLPYKDILLLYYK